MKYVLTVPEHEEKMAKKRIRHYRAISRGLTACGRDVYIQDLWDICIPDLRQVSCKNCKKKILDMRKNSINRY